MEKYQFSEQERATLEGLQQAFAVYQFVDKRVVTLILSDGFCEMFGYDDREQAYYDMDHNMYKDSHPDDVARIANAAIRFAKEEEPYDVVYRTKNKKDSDYHIIHATGKHVYTKSGVRLAHVWYHNEGLYNGDYEVNKSELNKLLNNALHEDSLVKKSRFDYLTGLPNMTYFFETAEASRQDIEKNGKKSVVLFIDLNGMKFFNAKFGFAAGDQLLIAFGRTLSETFNNENCCHIGGDHFAVITAEDGLEESLRKLFRKSRNINDGRSLPVRVGIYPYSLENVSISMACDRAKFACDALRHTFESGYNYFDKELRDSAELRQYILTNLDRALEERWIQVYYQPIVRAVNGRVCDEEALARWIDPEKGFLSPAYFIPYLEDAGKIYKLDLYMVDRVLEKMKFQQNAGFDIVPNSINFSRSDFNACDIVEEVRKRVDAAGISHDKITIEVTESAVSDNFDFMKSQIKRFQDLGFPVWMDDFGSGYSSLDVLSSIRFDLLKFDMIFMKKFNEGDTRKIVLTELMRLATSLGLDTVCEGVETEEQVRFLQEIGCSKLQGFYFDKPIPLEMILERFKKGIQIGYEKPADTPYYETMGKVNLYDLSSLANDDNTLKKFFNTIPMSIIEVQDGYMRFILSNPSYRNVIKRYFNSTVESVKLSLTDPPPGAETFVNNIKQTCQSSGLMIFNETVLNGSVFHALARRIIQDPVTGRTAIVIAILSITDPDEGTTYANIARALASDYYNIYYVDLKTDKFIEYSSSAGCKELAMERHGENFFEAARRDTMTRIYEEDRQPFLNNFTKEKIVRELDEHGTFTATYRLMDTGDPMYVNMKISRMLPDTRHIIIGISIFDSQMKQKKLLESMQRERAAYSRIMALSGNYLTFYTVNLNTDKYYEYDSNNEYKSFGLDISGDNFFEKAKENAKKYIFEDDQETFIRSFNKEAILSEIKENGSFKLDYHLIINGKPVPVQLKIVSVKESDGEKLIIGVKPRKSKIKR